MIAYKYSMLLVSERMNEALTMYKSNVFMQG